MIPNVTRGGDTRGVLYYLVGKGKKNEHEDPHLVAGSPEAVRMAEGRILDGHDAGDLGRFLDEPRELFGTKVTIPEHDGNGRVIGARDGHVWHCSLALHPNEPSLDDVRWGEMCDQFVGEMGFAGDQARAHCRWVAVRHGRSAGGSDHVHVVLALVAEDGSKARIQNDRPRSQQACRTLEQRFGLRALEARARGAGSRGIKPGERYADSRRQRDHGPGGEHPEHGSRQTLERIVRACATASRNEAEFVPRVREQGLSIRPRYAKGTGDKVVGYSVRLPGAENGAGRAVWYAGGKLARDLTLPALRHAWRQGPEAERAALREWNPNTASQARTPAEQRAELEERGVMWHRATADIERIRRQLYAAGDDPAHAAHAAHAARDAAAVLSAWSLALEGEQPGPLARAARQVARSCEQQAHRRALPGQPVARASGLALFLLASGQPDSTFGWVLVGRELTLLARELGRSHRLRGDLQRAEEIETVLVQELDGWRATLESDRGGPSEPLDAEAQAAQRTRDPLVPPEPRARPQTADDDVDAVRRLIDQTRRRPRRQR